MRPQGSSGAEPFRTAITTEAQESAGYGNVTDDGASPELQDIRAPLLSTSEPDTSVAMGRPRRWLGMTLWAGAIACWAYAGTLHAQRAMPAVEGPTLTQTDPAPPAPIRPVVLRDDIVSASVDAHFALVSAQLGHQRILSYPFEAVWTTAIRYLRVDRGFSISDRDPEAGYILFEFDLGTHPDGSPNMAQGSLEAFRTQDSSGRAAVQVQVKTFAGPVHMPHAIVEGLAAKLKLERGQPPPPPREQPPQKKPEAPPDDPSDEDEGSELAPFTRVVAPARH